MPTRSLPAFLSPASDSYGHLMAREVVRREYRGQFSADVAQRRENMDKNRYGDILAYDATRVPLPNGRYINANWIHEPASLVEGHASTRRWLATQGPLTNTLYDFWSLVLALPVADAPRRIVMLTALTEGARIKCDRYFPPSPTAPALSIASSKAGDKTIEVRMKSTTRPRPAFKRNLLEVSYEAGEPVLVEHLECLAWHDHGVPERPDDLLDLLDAVGGGVDEPPTLVHCSAGVGRTGTLIATAALLQAVPAMRGATVDGQLMRVVKPSLDQPSLPSLRKSELSDPVALTVDHLRAQRCLMVQTREQLQFIYSCIAQAWTMAPNDA